MSLHVVASQAAPEPPYPADTRSRGYLQTVDLARAMTSRTWLLADPECRPWLWQLWLLSWGNTPTGTWEPDDELIAAAIGAKMEFFLGHREQLMRGWTLHSDGRLYHPFITEQVLAMLESRRFGKERQKRYAEANKARHDASRGTDGGHQGDRNDASLRVTDASLRVTNGQEEEEEEDRKKKDTQVSRPESAVDLSPAPARTPFDKILTLWREVLPELPQPHDPSRWTEARKTQIRARWRDELPDLDSWRALFEDIRRSPFLMGKVPARPGRKAFQCDLFWVTKPENLLKISEGRYDA